MARVRCITEMGMGVYVHGRDATKAARRAVSDMAFLGVTATRIINEVKGVNRVV